MSERLLAAHHAWLQVALRQLPVPLRPRARMQIEFRDDEQLRISQPSIVGASTGLHRPYTP